MKTNSDVIRIDEMIVESEQVIDDPIAESSSEDSDLAQSDLVKIQRLEVIESINQYVQPHMIEDCSPIKSKLSEKKAYIKRKSNEISTAVRKVLNCEDEATFYETEKIISYYEEIMNNMKYQFEQGDYEDKKKLLILLPKQMTHYEIQGYFKEDATRYLIDHCKDLQRQKCKFSSIIRSSIPKNKISDTTRSLVENFFEDDVISRMMPGRQDSVRNTQITRVLQCSLNETYVEFKNRYPEEKLGLTKFTQLRLKHCIKLGPKDQHNVCVCQIHQNMKLMIEGAINSINSQENCEFPFQDCKELISFVICGDEKIEECSITMCGVCRKNLGGELPKLLRECFNNNQKSKIKFKQWSGGAVKCSLDTLEDDMEELIKKFIIHLKKLIPHHFISKEQSKFLKDKKESLQDGELLVQCDFAENYSFIVQDSVQGYHWNNAQATVHPFIIYYKDPEKTSVKHETFIIISNCMEHDSIAVHLFKTKMILFIREKITSTINKIFYMSDGAITQYKNKNNLINLCHHEDDFNIAAE